MHYVYILKSLKKDWYYVGVSSDINTRLKKHNWGHTPSTKKYRPLILIHTETFNSKAEAIKREKYLKSPQGYLCKRNIIKRY